MPAETHSHFERPDAAAVLELLTQVLDVDVDPADAPELLLADLGVADELAIMRLWDDVVEEFGERTVGEPDDDFAGDVPETLGELAERYVDALGGDEDGGGGGGGGGGGNAAGEPDDGTDGGADEPVSGSSVG